MGYRKTPFVTLAVLLLFVGSSVGQSGNDALPVLDRCHWLRLEIILGRLHAIDCGNQKTSFFRAQDAGRGSLETVRTSIEDERLSIWFRRVDPQYDLQCEILHSDQVRLVRQDRELYPGIRVEYRQPAVGDCELTIVSRQRSEHLAAPTLWHLLLMEPHATRDHLIPLFKQLHSGWDLVAKTRRLESLLIQMGQHSDPREQLVRWVHQLDAPRFLERQAAERALRRAGFVTLAYPDLLNPRELSTEQRIRLSRIRRALDVETGDTPQRVASWLRYDKFIWFPLLNHRALQVRELALRQLHEIAPHEVAFDPAATTAERQRQLVHLQSQWLTR